MSSEQRVTSLSLGKANFLPSIDDNHCDRIICVSAMTIVLIMVMYKVLQCTGKQEMSYPFPNRKILYSSKLKEFANDNHKFDENDRKFSKQVENVLGKGEVTRCEQFLLCPQCFQMTCTADT